MVENKGLLGCAFVMGLLAVALAILALSQPFWYVKGYTISDLTNPNRAVAYGVTELGLAKSDSDIPYWSQDSSWDFDKWEDVNTAGFGTLESDVKDCKKAAENGLAWGIMGLVATAPAAVICVLTCCCHGKVGCMGKFCNFIALGCLGFATGAFLIAPAVLAGECEDLNKKFMTAYGLSGDLDVGWSLITMLVALCFVFISFLAYFGWWCKSGKKDDHDQETTQKPSDGQA